MPLDDQVKSLSSTFKSNLGTFLSRVLQQSKAENVDIEALLTDLDRVISNQKELSELIQKGTNYTHFYFYFIQHPLVKLHQKINKELEVTNENIKITQNSILNLIEELREKDLDMANKLLQTQNLKTNLKALEISKLSFITESLLIPLVVINDPESAILGSMNLAITTGAPVGWTPSQPLINNKPPYPTEDLIRRSALYQMMTQSAPAEVENKAMEMETEDLKPIASTAPVRSRRRGAANGDKSKLLDLDLNPDI